MINKCYIFSDMSTWYEKYFISDTSHKSSYWLKYCSENIGTDLKGSLESIWIDIKKKKRKNKTRQNPVRVSHWRILYKSRRVLRKIIYVTFYHDFLMTLLHDFRSVKINFSFPFSKIQEHEVDCYKWYSTYLFLILDGYNCISSCSIYWIFYVS